MIRYSRPAQLQLEELAEAARLGVTLAVSDRTAILGPLGPTFASTLEPVTTGVPQPPSDPGW
jgi:hypothetical protein